MYYQCDICQEGDLQDIWENTIDCIQQTLLLHNKHSCYLEESKQKLDFISYLVS